MKNIFVIILVLIVQKAWAQPTFELSQNIYRSPYINGQEYGVAQDEVTHSPLGAYDLRATGVNDCDTHKIVAAGPGIVRYAVDSYNVSGPGNSASNNYLWIQHTNGEWTKYTHFKQNSIQVTVGQTVCEGTFLGYECAIGAVSPANFRHLHFEVRRPVDPINPNMDLTGGFMDSTEPRLIPVVCDITNNHWAQGDVNTAANCSCSMANESFNFLAVGNGGIEISLATTSVTAGTAVTFSNGSNGFFRAGNNVTFTPGFTASAGSYFSASVGSCGVTPLPGGCN